MKQVISVRILGPSMSSDFGGFACYAYVIRDKEGHLLHEAFGLAEKANSQASIASSSIAAYTALIRALQWLIHHGYQDEIIIVKSSSKSVVSQLDEAYPSSHQVTESRMPKSVIPLHEKASRLKSKFYKISFESVKSKSGKQSSSDSNEDTADVEERKEIEELLVMAYVEAEEKIMRQNRMLVDQNSPFVTAAQLMKYDNNKKQVQTS